MAILKKFSIAMLAGGLAVGVLAPGSIANAEVGAVVHTTEDPDAVVSDPTADPTADPNADPNADPKDEEPAQTADPDPATNEEVPAVPATPNATDPDGIDLSSKELEAKVAAAAPDFVPLGSAASSMTDGFRAGYIISDANFYRRNAMTVAQIQTLLNQKIQDGRCTIGAPGRLPGTPAMGSTVAAACLKDMRFTSNSRPADAYCNAYSGKSGESAAEIIYKVSAACGISAQALLVMLDKEQSLVSDNWPVVKQYERAMGYGCPDSGPGGSANCDAQYYGFFNQVYLGARQFQRYRALPDQYKHKPFKTNNILFKPIGQAPQCGTSPVYIQNYATAGLYNYTPYQPDQAALNAGLGLGGDCSSYGNRNFFVYYKQWFGTPNSFFGDVTQSQQFFKEIEWMGTSGLSKGFRTVDGRGVIYQPSAPISREAMAAFLYRLKKANFTPPATSPFADVNPGDSFYREITWMHAMGYSTGTRQPSGKPLYSPKAPVSRSAMAAFLYRFQGANYTAPTVSPFADMKPGDNFYREITWMYAVKYSTGNRQPSGKPIYLPRDNVSRGAMAAFIYRMQH